MHNTLRTPFWRAAYQSLPRTVRARYLSQIESAERLELTLDATLEALSKAKGFLSGLFNTPAKPRSAH
jgi:hypothetical protein